MALVKIQKMNKTMLVTKSSFENYFKNAGWNEVDTKSTLSNSPEAPAESKKNKSINTKANEVKTPVEPPVTSGDSVKEDEWAEAIDEFDEIDEGVQKPISEMTRNELIQFAKDNDISLAGVNKTNQIREAIKTALKDKEV